MRIRISDYKRAPRIRGVKEAEQRGSGKLTHECGTC